MLKKIKESFQKGDFDKYEYMKLLHHEHKKLFEYSDILKDTKFKEITINQKSVTFTMESLYNMDIKMTCLKHDQTSVPFTFFAMGGYDTKETEFLCSTNLIKKDAVIFDVGANLGWYTIHWMKKFPGCKVYSFEPVRETFEKLLDNVVINGLKPYRVQNLALSDKNGETDIYVDLERVGASSMVNLRGTPNTIIQKCRTQTLDDFFYKVGLKRLDLIKIDVEGAEKLVIDGGLETIKKYKPVIYAELLRKWSAKFGYHPNEIIATLAEIGYKCYIPGTETEIREITEQTPETNFVFIFK